MEEGSGHSLTPFAEAVWVDQVRARFRGASASVSLAISKLTALIAVHTVEVC